MAELSNFQKQFLGASGHVQVFTQKEFDEALALAQAEIMAVAIETSKKVILIEREECYKIAMDAADKEEEGELATALRNVAESIKNRMPSQVMES